MQNNYLYFLDSKPYLNLTNKCTNSCVFCIRDIKDDVVGSNLWINGKTFAKDIINQFTPDALEQIKNSGEITFCGYGEPMLEIDTLIEISKYLKNVLPDLKIRINTNGHASKVLKRDILPELKGLVNTISVSLNAHDKETYDKVSKPRIENAYEATLETIKQSAELGFDTIATIVVGFDDKIFIDTKKCEEIASNLNAKFRIRKFIKNGY